MDDNPRLADLQRRVRTDPASISFAALAEEFRRTGRCAEAVETCRAGLVRHPMYVSARVTLGRALLEMGALDDARVELDQVLALAPENLAAIRGLAEIHHRRGQLPEALEYYRSALDISRNDRDLQETVERLARMLQPGAGTQDAAGLSFDHVVDAIMSAGASPPPAPPAAPAPAAGDRAALPSLERFLQAILAARGGPGAVSEARD